MPPWPVSAVPAEIIYRKEDDHMFCRFCGKRIETSARVCPFCGESQESLSGGNGFWDILNSKGAAPAPAVSPASQEKNPPVEDRVLPPVPRPAQKSKKKNHTMNLILLMLAICIVYVFILGVRLEAVSSRQKAITSEAEENQTAQETMQAEIDTLARKVAQLDAAVPEETEAAATEPPTESSSPAAQESTPIADVSDDVFLTEPQDAIIKDDGSAVFTAEIADLGSEPQISWQYWDESERRWQTVSTDGDHYSVSSTGKNQTTLTVHESVSHELEGKLFRCCVTINGKQSTSRQATIRYPEADDAGEAVG